MADILGERDQRRHDAALIGGEPGAEQDPHDRHEHAERGGLPQQNRHLRGPVWPPSRVNAQAATRARVRVATWCHR